MERQFSYNRQLSYDRYVNTDDHHVSFKKICESEYRFAPHEGVQWPMVTSDMKIDFDTNGYVVVRKLLNTEELEKLCLSAVLNKEFWNSAQSSIDQENKQVHQVLWDQAGDDILGVAAGCSKTAGLAEQLLNKGQVSFHKGKLVRKVPQVGGTMHWHQDYGYWYETALFPHFVSCMMALTNSGLGNGGLELLKGSQMCGRIEHDKVAGQLSADRERVKMLEEHLPCVRLELEAGDAVLYHGNILHSSGPNKSEHLRWHLIFSYNSCSNTKKEHKKVPIQTHPANAIQLIPMEIEHRSYCKSSNSPIH